MADGLAEAVVELNKTVFRLVATVEQLERQADIQKRIRGAARDLAIASRQLQIVSERRDLQGLLSAAQRQHEFAQRTFRTFLADLPGWSYAADFHEPGRWKMMTAENLQPEASERAR